MKRLTILLVAMLALGANAVRGDDAANGDDAQAKPSTQISDGAKPLVDQISQAYAKLKSLDLAGTISDEVAIEGSVARKDSTQFKASFVAPNKFRHEISEDVLLGSTGQKVYSYKTAQSVYTMDDATKDRSTASKDLPQDMAALLELQNPSLMLALSKDPAKELTDNVASISKVNDTKIGDASLDTIKLALADKSSVSFAVDPRTHLIRRAVVDLTAALKDRRPDLTAATVTIDYTKVTPDAGEKNDQFAWAPPEGAKNAANMAKAQTLDAAQASELEGKPAPKFTLEPLSGEKKVSLASLKGKVVVLDFWATWCGPCRMSLPHLNKLYQEMKGDGVQFYALNLKEDKGTVEPFVKDTKLTVPVLLDSEGKTAEAYGVEGIPTTVVIGKDGKVSKVFVGYSDGLEAQLKSAIQNAMK